ncbi:MAG: DNA-directed RNA polymerase subunit omega [Pseudomonadota bacterium]
MARVTVEDCLERVENRFALVHATSKRVKQLYRGSAPRIHCTNREVVTALREIADGDVNVVFDNPSDETEE